MNYIKLIKKYQYFILGVLFFLLFLLFLYFFVYGFTQKVYKERFDSNDKDIIFVTAFTDIGRDNWKHSKRTNKKYFQWFYNLANNIDYKLLVFIDDDIKDELFSKYNFRDNIKFYKRTDATTFLDNESFLKKEQMILDSNEFKNKIPKNAENLPLQYTKLICTFENPHTGNFTYQIFYNDEFVIPSFLEKMIGNILLKLFHKTKQFIENCIL